MESTDQILYQKINDPVMARKSTDSGASQVNPAPIVTTAELLARVLSKRKHLDLANKVVVDSAGTLGVGGFADVDQGLFIDGGEKIKVAVKRIRIYIEGDEKSAKVFCPRQLRTHMDPDAVSFPQRIANEIRIWSELEHKNVMPLRGLLHRTWLPVHRIGLDGEGISPRIYEIA